MKDQEQPAADSAASAAKNNDSAQFVSFQLADQEYAFRIGQIQEIVIQSHVTVIPQVPDYVDGVSNLRGTIIPIINLRKLFGLESRSADDETRIIVVNVRERTMGCTVDSVSHVIRIPAENIQSPPEMIASEKTAHVEGLAKQDGRLIILLSINELLEPEKLETVHQAAILGQLQAEGRGEEASS